MASAKSAAPMSQSLTHLATTSASWTVTDASPRIRSKAVTYVLIMLETETAAQNPFRSQEHDASMEQISALSENTLLRRLDVFASIVDQRHRTRTLVSTAFGIPYRLASASMPRSVSSSVTGGPMVLQKSGNLSESNTPGSRSSCSGRGLSTITSPEVSTNSNFGCRLSRPYASRTDFGMTSCPLLEILPARSSNSPSKVRQGKNTLLPRS